MAANPPSNSKSPRDDDRPADPQSAFTFEERVSQYWQKNPTFRGIVWGVCLVVILIIAGKGLLERYQRQKERGIENAFQAATTPLQLETFAADHPGHPLAGVAEVGIADRAYAEGKNSDALQGYQKALTIIAKGPLASRARLGEALCKVQLGNAAEGTDELKQILNDPTQFKVTRTEAAYQLASIAASNGDGAEVGRYVDKLNQIDPASPWARRGMILRYSMPSKAAAAGLGQPNPSAAAPTQPAATETKSSAGPVIQLKLPKK